MNNTEKNTDKLWLKYFNKKTKSFKDILNTILKTKFNNSIDRYYITPFNDLPYYHITFEFKNSLIYSHKKIFEKLFLNAIQKEYERVTCSVIQHRNDLFNATNGAITWSFTGMLTKPSYRFYISIKMNDWHAIAISDPLELLIPKLGQHKKN